MFQDGQLVHSQTEERKSPAGLAPPRRGAHPGTSTHHRGGHLDHRIPIPVRQLLRPVAFALRGGHRDSQDGRGASSLDRGQNQGVSGLQPAPALAIGSGTKALGRWKEPSCQEPQAGELRTAFRISSRFRYFSLSLRRALHFSVALLVQYRSPAA